MSSHVDAIFYRVQDSENVESLAYDINSRMLVVKFNNDTFFSYSELPLNVALGFISTESVGSYLHREIKSKNYKVIQLDEEHALVQAMQFI